MLLETIEFFTFENEIWKRLPDGTQSRLTESETDLVSDLAAVIEEFYPEAYAALSAEYYACRKNLPYFRFRMVARFIKCNFSQLDISPDMVAGMFSNFEYVPCPMRGECRNECVICRPRFNHKLSDAELRVMKLWYADKSEADIADNLCLSPHTVHNHIRNSYAKLKVRSKAEFVRYADSNSLFNEQ